MKSVYASPMRVYLCLGVLALVGLVAGANLPISLFPNSTKPIIGVNIGYGSTTSTEFMNRYGNIFESQLRAIATDSAEVEKTRAYYTEDSARYEIEFEWGAQPRTALKEVEAVVHSYASRLPDESRNKIEIYNQNSNSGFFAATFYSSARSLDELYLLLEPVLIPQVSKLRDVAMPELYNPMNKEVRIELDQNRMAAFQLMPRDIDQAVKSALTAFNGGSITVGDQHRSVQVPRVFDSIDDFNEILISTPAKRTIHLTDIARIDYDLKTTNVQSWKMSGVPSLLLFSRPRLGGNVKRMSEEITEVIKATMPSLPSDVHYKVMVDPSQFIRSAVSNVFQEVVIGAFLAVLILFVFIGNLKNTVTAAIEIPLSMILAFIPMKLSGMSLNLISLGGLALSAGMNVDASVVVMENIFRHFENNKFEIDFEKKLSILVRAVDEVKFPVIASTIAVLVVFLPLAFTSDLAYAVLGDLAKAVVFSHGFSAFVALILVPTVRLQLMSHGVDGISHSPFDRYIVRVEQSYVHCLERFLENKKSQHCAYIGLIVVFLILASIVLPRLPKELIGKPDTSDIMINMNTQGNTLLKQMEDISADVEARILEKFKGSIDYTLVNSYSPNGAWMIAHLKNRSEMRKIWKEVGAFLTDSPTLRYNVEPWNPAELSIPNPPQLRIAVRGGKLSDRAEVARDIYQLLEENQVFPRQWTDPGVGKVQNVVLRPYLGLWSNLKIQAFNLTPSDLADLVRVMTGGRKIGELSIDGVKRDISLTYAPHPPLTEEDIGSLPIGLGDRIVPVKALSQVRLEDANPLIYQEDQRDLYVISGKQNEGESSHLANARIRKAESLVAEWKKNRLVKQPSSDPMVIFEEASRELQEAMGELGFAIFLSIGLIFLILMIQFGDFGNALLVLVAIPLGMIGVLASLFMFNSTLSLNSILGVILLNGIAVANSIILVDFMKRQVDQGLQPKQCALEAARKRIRPIFITSLTTILGMLPVALGLGEGGRVLQPLGISVAGGLWVSMGLTLFVVPALQVDYLHWKQKRKMRERSRSQIQMGASKG